MTHDRPAQLDLFTDLAPEPVWRRYAECGICCRRVDPDTEHRTDDGPRYAKCLACPAHAGCPRFSDEAKAWAESGRSAASS